MCFHEGPNDLTGTQVSENCGNYDNQPLEPIYLRAPHITVAKKKLGM